MRARLNPNYIGHIKKNIHTPKNKQKTSVQQPYLRHINVQQPS